MEKYTGIKFKYIKTKTKIQPSEELIRIGKEISKIIKIKGNEGNLSIRKKNGFLIKRAGANMGKLKAGDGVFVERIEGGTIYSAGKTPSSESIMHHLIYKKRKDINLILHFHLDELLKKKIGFEIGPFDYGTIELANAVSKASKKENLIKIRKHGFVLLSKNKKELIQKLFEICDGYGLC
ncbi:MAG: class II aldolase/adducin family protein [Candidatus Micrarchaeia archaeon]